MRTIVSAAAIACLFAGAAVAQTTTTPGSTAGATKMSQAECTSSWTRLDMAKSGSVTKAQSESMVTNFSAADANKDGNLSQTEFMDACQKGLVTASTGTGTGTRGLSGSGSTGSGSGTSTTPGASGTTGSGATGGSGTSGGTSK